MLTQKKPPQGAGNTWIQISRITTGVIKLKNVQFAHRCKSTSSSVMRATVLSSETKLKCVQQVACCMSTFFLYDAFIINSEACCFSTLGSLATGCVALMKSNLLSASLSLRRGILCEAGCSFPRPKALPHALALCNILQALCQCEVHPELGLWPPLTQRL